MVLPRTPKYKTGDALMTQAGLVFTIKYVDLKKMYNHFKGVYVLVNHPHKELPIAYIDHAKYIMLATVAAKVLYGTRI